MKCMVYRSFLLFYLIAITSTEIEFIAVRLPLKVIPYHILLQTQRHFHELNTDQKIHRIFRVNVHHQIQYGLNHSNSMLPVIYSIFVLIIFQFIRILKFVISSQKLFNDINHSFSLQH